MEEKIGSGLRSLEGFLFWMVGLVLSEHDLVGCQMTDLRQEAMIAIWKAEQSWRKKGAQIGERGYIRYLVVACFGRMEHYLRRMRRQMFTPPGYAERAVRGGRIGGDEEGILDAADEGGIESTRSRLWVEHQLELVEAVLLDQPDPEQGARDFQVFRAWVLGQGNSIGELADTLSMKNRTIRAVLERVILILREYFGGDVHAPIVLSAGGNIGASRGFRKSRPEMADYQSNYYERNKDRLGPRARERMRARRAAAKQGQSQSPLAGDEPGQPSSAPWE